MIHVTLKPADPEAPPQFIGKFSQRKLAYREAKRAAGIPNTHVIVGEDQQGYVGPNGMAWIVL